MEKTDKRVIGAGYHRPVCAKCHCEMRPETNGVGLLDMFKPSDKPEPQPYELWDADLWKCPKCGIEVVGGFANGPISSHFEEVFQDMIKHYKGMGLIIENTG